MNDDIIKRAVRASASDAPDFETVVASRPHRRVRTLRAGLIAVLVLAAVGAPFALHSAPDETQIAMLTPPTTDWLLQTPDPQWVAELDQETPHNSPVETPHVH